MPNSFAASPRNTSKINGLGKRVQNSRFRPYDGLTLLGFRLEIKRAMTKSWDLEAPLSETAVGWPGWLGWGGVFDASAQTPGFPGVEDFAPVTPHVGSDSDQPARATSGRRCATRQSIRAESVA